MGNFNRNKKNSEKTLRSKHAGKTKQNNMKSNNNNNNKNETQKCY